MPWVRCSCPASNFWLTGSEPQNSVQESCLDVIAGLADFLRRMCYPNNCGANPKL